LQPPYIPGVEAAGFVEHVGAQVTDVAVGDRVAYVALSVDSYAEFTAVKAERLRNGSFGFGLLTASTVAGNSIEVATLWPKETPAATRVGFVFHFIKHHRGANSPVIVLA